MSDRLKLWECQLDDASCGGATRDPHWLQQLRLRLQGSQAGNDGDCAGAYLPPVDGRTLANQDTDLSAPGNRLTPSITKGQKEEEEEEMEEEGMEKEEMEEEEMEEEEMEEEGMEEEDGEEQRPWAGQEQLCNHRQTTQNLRTGGPSVAVDQQLGYQHPHAARVLTPPLATAVPEAPPPSATGFLPMVPLEHVSGDSLVSGGMNGAWPSVPQAPPPTAEEETAEPDDTRQQDAGGKGSWFSKWFKSKPKTETSDQAIPAPTPRPPTSTRGLLRLVSTSALIRQLRPRPAT
ncbi:hypothetical protein CRUP_024283 [Coryphaenoides rupestris]|nr:hypothetical protein CRUP_024283 [Coryphaenoides rupestris]